LSFLGVVSIAGHAQKASFQFTYEAHVRDIPANAKSFSMVVPVPESGPYQEIADLSIATEQDYQFQQGERFGNRYLLIQAEGQGAPDSVDFAMSFKVTRQKVAAAENYRNGREDKGKYTKADSLIPLNATIRKEAENALSKGEESRGQYARSFYEYLIGTMQYDKSGEGWGQGDAIYACNAKQGNCTDFHSLFIGMCRTQEIPARFHIGFPVPKEPREGEIKGYHCWAEFFSSKKGWVPLDISEAWKNTDKKDFYFGGLDPHRVKFTSGRDIPVQIQPGVTKQLNYFIYPKVFVNQKAFEKVDTRFYYHYQEP